jgi:UDPglucose 6-dehydrogenase
MKTAVIGTGYVGLVVGACLAETGNDVVCADVDTEKIAALKEGRIPIYEPGLDLLVTRNQDQQRLHFTTDVGEAIRSSEIIFIAVGTPPDEDGSADLQHVLDVARTIGQNMNEPKLVATKSTVPVGTGALVRRAIAAETDTAFEVCSAPEFLKEGAAVDDFMHPDRIVIGVESEEAAETLRALYAPFVRTGNPILFMDVPSAEMTKYAANAMLATRISFMNQIAALCEEAGADVNEVRRGIGSDRRIGSAFLFPGPGYGGSCFPKDVRALIRTGAEHGVDLAVLTAVEEINDRQKERILAKLLESLDDAQGARVAIWGLAFKAETDDMRESPSVVVVRGLLEAGVEVSAHDPAAAANARQLFGDRIRIEDNAYDAVRGASALCILTEWLQYRNPDFPRIKALMARPVIIDGRNLFEPARLGKLGFRYVSVGRASV